MTQLEVRLFGVPELLAAGVPLDLQQQKARALLFYLGATGRAHARDHLATLLWSESDAPEAYHSLRSTLYVIRRALQAHGLSASLVIERMLVSLQPQTLSCDLLRFFDLVTENTESTLAEALALCRGPFLQGFTLRDAPEFDRWQRRTATDLLTACRAALERLIDLTTQRGASSDAMRYLQLLTQLDPLDEPAQRRLKRSVALLAHISRKGLWLGRCVSLKRLRPICARSLALRRNRRPLLLSVKLCCAEERHRSRPNLRARLRNCHSSVVMIYASIFAQWPVM
jgi:DNA-binding SARP family transcriptional activator